MTVKVKKSNRIIEVDENEVQGYLGRGYDRINNVGEVVEFATGGKKISIAEHNKLRKEVEQLKSANGGSGDNNRIAELEKQVEDLKADLEVTEKENERLEGILKAQQNKNNGNGYNKNK